MKLRVKRWGWAAAVAVITLTAGVWMGLANAGNARQDESAAPALRASRRVRTAPVERRPLVTDWEGHGQVRAGDRASLAFTVGGRLQARSVDVGDHVRRGQALARLDARAFQHARSAAQADLARAQSQRLQSDSDATRLAGLGALNAIPREQVERVQSALRVATASEQAAQVQLNETQRALSETVLRAPFAAVVSAVHLQPGEMSEPGAAVLVLSGRGGREVEVEVPVATSLRIVEGSAARVSFPLSGQAIELPARVQSVGSATQGGAGLVPVVVALDALDSQHSTSAVPGAAARVRIPTTQPARLSVPVAAVLDPSGSRPAVLRVRRGHVQRVAVQVSGLTGARVLVQGPLEADDTVVVSGTAALRDGDAVEVLP